MKNINLLVVGTSIMWGQGLEEPDKMHNVLSGLLQDQFPDRKVNVIFLAHSGSSTGYRPDGSLDTKYEPRVHGEIPTFYPTIVQQIGEFDQEGIAPDSVNLILLDAGVNDVHVTTILDPFCRPRRIEKLVEIYCHQHMVILLDQLATKFKNATIMIVSYYQMLTEHSEEQLIHLLLGALGKVPMNFFADAVIGLFEQPLKRRVLVNCETFSRRSLAAFQQSAKQVNRQLSAKRIVVVPAPISAKHAALSADPWVFGINADLSAEDPVAKIRAKKCRSIAPGRTNVTICEKASAGHPNPKGAKVYADTMLKLILENNLTFGSEAEALN